MKQSNVDFIYELYGFMQARMRSMKEHLSENTELSQTEQKIISEVISYEQKQLSHIFSDFDWTNHLDDQDMRLIYEYIEVSKDNYSVLINTKVRNFDYYMRKISWFKIVLFNVCDIYSVLLDKER